MADEDAPGRLVRLEVDNFKSYRGQQVSSWQSTFKALSHPCQL